jgi:hypothetical protein
MSRTVRKTFFGRILPAMLFLAATAGVQAAVPGVPYQVPGGFESYPAGTLITFGGINYVSQGNGTMLLAASQPSQPVQPLTYNQGGVIYYNNPPVNYDPPYPVLPNYIPFPNGYASSPGGFQQRTNVTGPYGTTQYYYRQDAYGNSESGRRWFDPSGRMIERQTDPVYHSNGTATSSRAYMPN